MEIGSDADHGPRARPRRRRLMVVAVVVVAAVLALLFRPGGVLRRDPHRLSACEAVRPADLPAVLGVDPGVGRPDTPEGDRKGATMCSYGRSPGLGAIVFAVDRGARDFYKTSRTTRAREIDLDGDGYQAYAIEQVFAPGDGRGAVDSVWVLRGGQYVNVLLTQPPPGAARRLAPIIGRRLGHR